MSLTQHIGYGQFQLQDLLLGEEFARFDGTLAKVCDQQPCSQDDHSFCNMPSFPDHLFVWIDWNTSNARRVLLHRTALVHALSPEQACAIERRIRQPKEDRS